MTDTALNEFLAQGTTTDRLAFTPSPPTPSAGAALGYLWWDTTLQALYAWDDGSSSWVAAGGGGGGGGDLVALDEVIAAGGETSLGFTGISGSYRDLEISIGGRGSAATVASNIRMTFNGDTGANYSFSRANSFGTGGGNGQSWIEAAEVPGATAPATYEDQMRINIFNYAATTFYKTSHSIGGLILGTGLGGMYFSQTAGFWANTAAINQIDFALDSGSYIAGSKVTLWGRKSP